MKYVVVLLLLATMPMARAEVALEEVKKLAEASRLDLQILSFRLTMAESNNRVARGMPTEKLARIFREFAGKLDVQAIYNYAALELAASLDQQDLDVLMPCFTSDVMHKYHLAQYQRLTREGSKAFRDQLVPLDLGINQPDPDRIEKLTTLQNRHRNLESQKNAMKQMFWLINLDLREKYPMLARSKEDMDQYFDQGEYKDMSTENAQYSLLVSYVMLRTLNDQELADFMECQATPQMALYNDSTTQGLYNYLLDAETSWVVSAATDDR